MDRLYYFIYNAFYKRILKLYLRTDSKVKYDGFKLKVFKEVFHPKLFFSTNYFYSFINSLELNKKKFLELGCGSGVLSMLALRKGAEVTALDINEKAVENTRVNFSQNFDSDEKYSIILSDLFENLPVQHFDVIAINPPYYFKEVISPSQFAWYCGENGEYFQNLFSKLHNYINSTTHVYMILEENCEMDRIQEIALKNKLHFILVEEKKIKWERNYIFRIGSQSFSK